MDYLIRFAQVHESFRRPELEALAVLHRINLQIFDYEIGVRWYPALILLPSTHRTETVY